MGLHAHEALLGFIHGLVLFIQRVFDGRQSSLHKLNTLGDVSNRLLRVLTHQRRAHELVHDSLLMELELMENGLVLIDLSEQLLTRSHEFIGLLLNVLDSLGLSLHHDLGLLESSGVHHRASKCAQAPHKTFRLEIKAVWPCPCCHGLTHLFPSCHRYFCSDSISGEFNPPKDPSQSIMEGSAGKLIGLFVLFFTSVNAGYYYGVSRLSTDLSVFDQSRDFTLWYFFPSLATLPFALLFYSRKSSKLLGFYIHELGFALSIGFAVAVYFGLLHGILAPLLETTCRDYEDNPSLSSDEEFTCLRLFNTRTVLRLFLAIDIVVLAVSIVLPWYTRRKSLEYQQTQSVYTSSNSKTLL